MKNTSLMASKYTYAELEGFVQDVIAEKDAYFQKHPNVTSDEKDKYMQSKIQEIIRRVEEWKETTITPDEKQHANYLKARLLCIMPEYNAEAEKIMVQFVKFHPKNHIAWNILGEIYWRKNDHEMAKSCFEGSQQHVKNIEGIVNYSLLLRSIPTMNTNETLDNIKLSIEKAHEAVAIDVKHGKAWYALANGYLNLYFETACEPEYLKQALKAYQHAKEDQTILLMPEFHFNKGMAHRCNQDFEAALKSLEDALNVDPTWTKALDHYNGLLSFLHNIKMSLEDKGKLTSRRYKQFMKSFDQKLLGSYAKTSDDDNTPLTLITCASMKQGRNNEEIVLGKVVCQVLDPVPISFTFCIIDSSGSCFAVTMYNVASGKGVKIGDSVAIPKPLLECFDFKYKEKHYKFSWIKVENPLSVVVNGKPSCPSWQASLRSVSVFKPG